VASIVALGLIQGAHVAHSQPPVLIRFALNRGIDTTAATAVVVELTHTVVGERPTHYRVSNHADFSGSKWIPYVDAPTIAEWNDTAGPACDASHRSHLITLFLQVRVVTGADVRVVAGQRALVPTSIESNVMRDSICAIEGGSPL
jgi:hypothetical protein